MLPELRHRGIYVLEEVYNAYKELFEGDVTTNDFLATEIIRKFFSDYFDDKEVFKGFNFEEDEYFADLLNETDEGFLINVAKKKVDDSCFRYKYEKDFTCNLSGMAKLRDGSEVYVCLIMCSIVDKNDKYVASSVFCLTCTDESMETPAGISLYGFQSDRGCVSGNLDEFCE